MQNNLFLTDICVWSNRFTNLSLSFNKLSLSTVSIPSLIWHWAFNFSRFQSSWYQIYFFFFLPCDCNYPFIKGQYLCVFCSKQYCITKICPFQLAKHVEVELYSSWKQWGKFLQALSSLHELKHKSLGNAIFVHLWTPVSYLK